MVLMAVPRAVPKDANLGKPLGAHDEVALVSVSGNGERKFVVKGEMEANRLARRERFGKGDLHHRMVVLIAIVGRSELHALREVAIALGGDALDVDGALLPVRVGDAYAVLVRLPGKGGLGTESVEVEVKRNGGNGLVGGIAIFEDLGRIQGLGSRY